MAAAVRELFHLAAPVSVIIEGELVGAEGKTVVKGFVSVASPDRSGDMVFPEAFNIKQFMSAPTVLVNHEYWHDNQYNRVSVGRPISMHVVKIVKSDNPENWAVKDETTGAIIAQYPKQKSPNLSVGDRGLFAFVEITEPEVAKRVKNGELQAFSWKGTTLVDYKVNPEDNSIMRVLTDIDLYEISVVHMPDNPNSTFDVMKDAGMPLGIHSVRFEGRTFTNKDMVSSYLNQHKFDGTRLRERDGFVYSYQPAYETADIAKSVVVKMGDGVQFMAAPLKRPSVPVKTRLTNEEKDKLESLYRGFAPAASACGEKTLQEPKMATGEADKGAPAVDAGEQFVEKLSNALSVKMAAANAASISEALKPFAEQLGKFGETMSKAVEKMAAIPAATNETETKTETNTKAETTKEVPAVTPAADANGMGQFAEVMKGLAAKLGSLDAKIETISKAVPAATVRDERVEAEKAAKAGDKNAVFDATFAFLAPQ